MPEFRGRLVFQCFGKHNVRSPTAARQGDLRSLPIEVPSTSDWKIGPTKHLLALFLLVVLVLAARLVDVLAAIVGKRTKAVDSIDAWFRNLNSRLLR